MYYTDGQVYVGHFSRSYAEEIVSPQAAEVFDVVKDAVLYAAGDTGFLPTEVVTVTWQNVRPYPAYYWYYWYSWYYWYYYHWYTNLQVHSIDAMRS